MTITALRHLPEPPAQPDPSLRFKRRIHLGASMRELFQSGELTRSLAERDLKSRYKQAVLGVGWAVVTPLLLMVVSSVFFQRVARVDTDPAPYALFSYLGTLPWSFFNSALSNGGQSLVANNTLLNKVYCPREVFPIAAVLVSAVDLAIATGVLGVLFVLYGYGPTATAVWVPVLLAIQVAFTLGVVFIFSGVLVYVRDLRQALPMILQVGLFATPVFYGVDKFPQDLLTLYATVNPLVGVIDGYRRTVLYGQSPDWSLVGPGAATSLVILIVGYLVLKRLETRFADVA